MAPNAFNFSVIFSLFLLFADARLDASSAAVTVRDQEKKNAIETTAFHVSLPLTAFKDDGDLSRQIAHSLRFPLNRHRHRHVSLPHHRHVTLRPIEVPYGDDMVGLPKAEKKKKLQKMKKEKRDDDSDSDDDDDEIEHKKMKKMMNKNMKKEKEEKGGILKWISGFLN